MTSQTVGVVLLAVAAAVLWSVWALAVAGVLLLAVPELLALLRRRSAARVPR